MRKILLFAVVSLIFVGQSWADDINNSNPGVATWNLMFGGGSAAGPNRSTAIHGGSGLSFGVGGHLSLGISANYTMFTGSTPNDASYFLDAPVTLTGYFQAGGTLPMAISGGVGMGFSDLPEWRNSNRALTGHLGIAANFGNSMWLELKMIKAATSTGNVTFGFALLKYAISL